MSGIDKVRGIVNRLHVVMNDKDGEGTLAWAQAVGNLLDELHVATGAVPPTKERAR